MRMSISSLILNRMSKTTLVMLLVPLLGSRHRRPRLDPPNRPAAERVLRLARLTSRAIARGLLSSVSSIIQLSDLSVSADPASVEQQLIARAADFREQAYALRIFLYRCATRPVAFRESTIRRACLAMKSQSYAEWSVATSRQSCDARYSAVNGSLAKRGTR